MSRVWSSPNVTEPFTFAMLIIKLHLSVFICSDTKVIHLEPVIYLSPYTQSFHFNDICVSCGNTKTI